MTGDIRCPMEGQAWIYMKSFNGTPFGFNLAQFIEMCKDGLIVVSDGYMVVLEDG